MMNRHTDGMPLLMRFFAALAIVAALSVTGCAAPTPAAAPTTDPSQAVALPSSSPTAVPVAVDRIVFSADGFEVLGSDDSLIERSSILEDGAAILETLEAAFGREPEVSAYAGGIESQPGMKHTWGGLTVYVGETPYNYFEQDITVEITAAQVGEIELVSAAGTRIGTPLEELDGAPAFGPLDPSDFFLLLEPVTVGTAQEAGFPGEHPNGDLVWSIAAYGDTTGVTRIMLPSENYGV